MKKTNTVSKLLSVIICLVLTAAMALALTACGDTAVNSDPSSTPETVTDTVKTVGEGATEFGLTVTDIDGNSTEFSVKTDKKTVGDALLELGLIEGDQSEYGLYIKKVNGITADFETDKTYWAFYVGGEYATTGVDSTDIVAGESYELKVQK